MNSASLKLKLLSNWLVTQMGEHMNLMQSSHCRPQVANYNNRYKVLSGSSMAVIVITALEKKDERGGQGHTSESLVHQSAIRHRALNTHCFYS